MARQVAAPAKMHEAVVRQKEAEIMRRLEEKERSLQIREAEIQRMLQAVDERREALDLHEDSLQQTLAAVKEREENLNRIEVALTQAATVEGQRNGAHRDADLLSIASTIGNTSTHANERFSSKSMSRLKGDSEQYNNEG